MKIYYRIQKEEIEILRCFGSDSRVVLPGQIEGFPVVKVAAYAFSDRGGITDTGDRKLPDCQEGVAQAPGGSVFVCETGEDTMFTEDEQLLAGLNVEEIVFPDTVREIGNYIFYGCRQLKKLEFSNRLMQIGSGAFTRCSGLRYLKVHMKNGQKSCVKEILGELWQRIDVTFVYEQENSEAVLVFPEHYEEAVENTPARILFTQHHGSGNNYRQCFYNKEMDYRKYDSLFSVAAAWDRAEVLADIAFGRLGHPRNLAGSDRQVYQNLIRERYQEILQCLIEKDQLENIRLISAEKLWSREMLEYALDLASREKKMEILSYLMNEKQKNFKQQRKRFEL